MSETHGNALSPGESSRGRLYRRRRAGLFSCVDALWVYDVLSDSAAQKITGFGTVRSLAVTLDGRRAYVTDVKDDERLLIIVDLETYDIVKNDRTG